jgi:hypothetical protein
VGVETGRGRPQPSVGVERKRGDVPRAVCVDPEVDAPRAAAGCEDDREGEQRRCTEGAAPKGRPRPFTHTPPGIAYAAPDELDEPDDEPMFGQFAELCGVVLGVVVLGDVVVLPPEAAQAPPLAARATEATARRWRTRTIGYLLCRMHRSNHRHLRASAENAVNVLQTRYLRRDVLRSNLGNRDGREGRCSALPMHARATA